MANNPIKEIFSENLLKFNPNLCRYTKDIIFDEVLLDESLSSKTRSLVTLTLLTAIGNSDQMPYHLATAYQNGLTKKELSALCTHLMFYLGLPKTMLLVDQINAPG
ncbi:carboxymuconolactone decarboxylase family protein [Lactobacillus sp. DCY120]|uniref:Carboxymuconolactone decarboxylase family protein n=1 Tax=Bombilactobacillus apium TaxID=2675299 RepID=A0A850QZF9_9LACO|nr:carboxymuconolactone decarboxylase family protein [Bombilactobacillus apium]NVY96169.1 carboxymuconolactone decarboxylase family protein [Bombilactobacillus apium]